MPARHSRSANADRNRFLALYVVMVAGLLAAAGLFLYEARIILKDDQLDEEAFAVLGTANRLLHDLENAETGQRGYLLTGNESYLAPYREGVGNLDDTVLQLQRVVGADPVSVERVDRIEHAKTSKITELAQTIELERTGNRAAAITLVQTDEGLRDMDKLREELGLLLNDWRQKRNVALRDAHQRLVFGTAALSAVAALVCCLLVYTVFVQRRAFAAVHRWSEAAGHDAAHDPLTGLPNRRQLLSVIDALANRPPTENPGRIALLYLDVDGFKSVNDALGHSAGDTLLRRLAASLRAATREGDVLARVGGDEFVLLVTSDFGDDTQLTTLAEELIARTRLAGEHEYAGRFRIGLSIGITTFPDRVDSVEELLDVADAAMYAAKRSGRSTWAFGASPERKLSNVVTLPR